MKRLRLRAVLVTGGLLLSGCSSTVAGTAVAGPSVATTTSVAPTSTSSAGSSSGSVGDTTPDSTTSSGAVVNSSSSPASTGGDQSTSAGSSSSSSSSSSSAADSADYPTAPLIYPKVATTPTGANLVEARRIASALLPPTFIDNSYLDADLSITTLPLKNAAAMVVLFPDPVPAVAQRGGMITGFSSDAQNTAKNDLAVAAFEFPSGKAAAAAAAALSAAAHDKQTDKGKLVVPGYPAATGWYGNNGGSSGPYALSFLMQGPMVLYVYTSGQPQAVATALIRKSFDVEAPALKKYVPTPAAAIAALPLDPDGVWARTLPQPQGSQNVYAGVYTAAASLHFSNDPLGDRKALAAAGVDLVGVGGDYLYRARDAAGATGLSTDFEKVTAAGDPAYKPFPTPSAFPTAVCLQKPLDATYQCFVTHGRWFYDIETQSTDAMLKSLTSQEEMVAGA